MTNIRLFVDPQNPTRVGGLMDISDMDAGLAAMKTEAAAEAMAADGVLPETLVILLRLDPTPSTDSGSRRNVSRLSARGRSPGPRLGTEVFEQTASPLEVCTEVCTPRTSAVICDRA